MNIQCLRTCVYCIKTSYTYSYTIITKLNGAWEVLGYLTTSLNNIRSVHLQLHGVSDTYSYS